MKTIKHEEGQIPIKGQNVTVHYTGWLDMDGVKFDSSRDRDKPFTFVVGEGKVIQGWDKILQKMKLGSRVIATIPPVRNAFLN